MRDEPAPVAPQYPPAGPDAEAMAPPDNPPPASADPTAERDDENPMRDPELRRELGERLTGRGLNR
jgi:hypothetical protein